MSYMPSHYVLFSSRHDVTLEQAKAALESDSTEVSIVERRLREYSQRLIEVRDISFEEDDEEEGEERVPVIARVFHCSHADVLEESKEIAEKFAEGRADRDLIAACDRRFEVSADADDDMDYFNNWLIATERLRDLVDGIVFCPDDDTFLNDP